MYFTGKFIKRLNRFVIKVQLIEKGETTLAYLPNPGKLGELLLPENNLLLKKATSGKYPYRAWACQKQGKNWWILLDTHHANKIAKTLIEKKTIKLPFTLPKNFEIKEEPPFSHGRFDLMIKSEKRNVLIEVKSCTLFGEKIAMFPDAPTSRGKKHLEGLLNLEEEDALLIILIFSPEVEFFLPAYHIDKPFTESFLKLKEKVKILPLGVLWNPFEDRVLKVEEVKIPWHFLEKIDLDRGSYLLLFRLEKEISLENEFKTEVFPKVLPPGYYVYTGSAMKNLQKRVERHLRKRKKYHWHIDYLLSYANLKQVYPVVDSKRLECELAKALSRIADLAVLNFGSTDCYCSSHLFYFKENPFFTKDFQDLLTYYRLERPYEKILQTLKS